MKRAAPFILLVVCLCLLGLFSFSPSSAQAAVRIQAGNSFAYACDGKYLRVGVFVTGASAVRFSRGGRDWSGVPARGLLSGGRFWNIRLPLVTGMRAGNKVSFAVRASGPSGSDRAMIRPTVSLARAGSLSPCPMPVG